jgi:hypothetical protein
MKNPDVQLTVVALPLCHQSARNLASVSATSRTFIQDYFGSNLGARFSVSSLFLDIKQSLQLDYFSDTSSPQE